MLDNAGTCCHMAETFIPLFSSTVRSSLWSLSGDCIKVFLTFALEAGPDGVVVASVDGIRRIVDMPLASVKEHIATLESADEHSKDIGRGGDGRRLERVPNGWRVVNMEWYREEARRQAELFRKRKWWNEKGDAARRDARPMERETYPEMEMETYTERDPEREGSPEGSTPAAPTPAAVAAPSPKKRTRKTSVERWRFVPEPWVPLKRHRDKAFAMGWTPEQLQLEVDRYRAHEFKVPKSDPDKTFDAWLLSPMAQEGKGQQGASRARQSGNGSNAEVFEYIFKQATRNE